MSESRFEPEPPRGPRRGSWKRGLVIMIVLVVAALLAALFWSPNFGGG